jgi:ABC-type multidrug transport system fused ATPase/permease subunit
MVVFSIISKQRRKVLKYSDLRVKMMNEILAGVRIIKFYAWERPFGKEVGEIRGKELAALTKMAYTIAIGFSLILMAAPLIQPVLVFLTYVNIQDEPLSAATAFTTVALFNMMRFPFAFLPMGLLQYIQSKIALSRLERYLDLPELSEYVLDAPPDEAIASEETPGSVTIRNGSFSWIDPEGAPVRPIQDETKPKKSKGPKSTESLASDSDMRSSTHSRLSLASESTNATPIITLQHVNCHIPSGSLVAVVGPVGCGKSSFLSAILGELEPIHNSKIHIPRPENSGPGYVSYCSQTPWVVNDTLRGNVLFGRAYDEERYNSVIEACALLADLVVLPAGDSTEIGERGINLSGGQKARVSLARSLYAQDTKLVLMDDPLSAVDSHVGEHIFSDAIRGAVSKNMTRILVTHHVHLLSRCDSVIVLEKGTVKHHGTYAELVAQGVDFAGAIDVSKVKDAAEKVAEETKDEEQLAEKKEISKVDEEEKSAVKQDQLKKSGKQLVKDEGREEGIVAGSAYVHYANAGGMAVAILICVVQGVGRGAEVASAFWLASWAKNSIEASRNGNPMTNSDTTYYVGVYAALGCVGILGLTARSLLIAVHRLRASKKLHDGLTNSILRAPVAFFDVTPTGRILNRFAADMDKVDLELTQSLSQGVSTVFNVLGAIAAIISATKGTFLGPMIPIGYAYYMIQKWFRKTSTELQRVTSVANSPIFADFSQILSGTSTIRAYGEETRFFNQCSSSFDKMNASFILVQLCSSWLSLRLDLLGGCMGAFIGGIAVATKSSGFIPAGWLGLALSYSIEVTNFLKHGVKMIATIEAQMNSVERILDYTDNVEPEAPEFIPDTDPSADSWPMKGEIEFRNTSLRYRDGPLVLKDLSLTVKAGEKVGVCGRTGSGKSSLMVALFRISEIEKENGAIIIDGVNICDIGTSALRLNLSIIPQDPIIFSNTVRYNLDPFAVASDEELWEVLEKVQMGEVIAALPGGLEEHVAEGGENFSQGQRQLLCIGRKFSGVVCCLSSC